LLPCARTAGVGRHQFSLERQVRAVRGIGPPFSFGFSACRNDTACDGACVTIPIFRLMMQALFVPIRVDET